MAMKRDRSASMTRFVSAGVGLFAALGAVVMVNLLLSQKLPRIDVTATGQLALAPRSVAVLAEAPPDTRIVLAADLTSGRYSPTAVRRVRDMLDEIDRASSRVSVTSIDTGSATGRTEFERFVESMLERDAGEIAAASLETERAAAMLDEVGEQLVGFARTIESIRGMTDPATSDALAPRASQLRATAEQVPPMTAAVRGHLNRQIAERSAPNLVAARSLLLDSMSPIRTLLAVLAEDMTVRASGQALEGEAAARATALGSDMTDLAEQLGVVTASLETSALPSVIRAVAALEASEALLVLGPTGAGVNAVALSDLMPESLPGAPSVDVGRVAESLITNAVATLDTADRPIVVLVHASPRRLLRSTGDGVLDAVRRRSALRGIEWIEWPLLLEPDQPSVIALARAESRPVVFTIIGVDSSASGGQDRAARTATVTSSLVNAGERVLINLAPSTLPGLGNADPMQETIEPLGLAADTGRPVLRQRDRGNDRFVDWELTLVPEKIEHPLGAAVARLATLVPWPLIIEPAPETDPNAASLLRLAPILTIQASSDTWREGEWLGYWVTNPQQRPLLRDKPSPGGTRDAPIDAGVIAWAVERKDSNRVVVIGSHLWMFDQSADRPAVIDGRVVQTSTGNSEFFLACIEWLAGNDSMLAPSAIARSTPTVQTINGSRLTAIRWSLVGGLPVLVLMLGIGFRVIRG